MATIVQNDNPILRETAKAVSKEQFGSKELRDLVAHMSEALDRELDGVALAAPQIGVSLRVFIVRIDRTLPPLPEGSPRREPQVDVYINPEIIRRSRKKQQVDEGCLSVRGVYGHTKRPERTTVRAYDVHGKKFERGAGGLLAQIFSHEIDHLNGILFTDDAIDLFEIKHDTHEPVA